MPTIKDVAGLAGVSVATVSRYLNDSGYVSENAREKIAKAIKKLDYTPNEVARSLYKKTSKLVGLLVPQIDNPYFNNIITGVESVCNERGFHLIISNVSKKEDEKKYIESFMTNNVAGIISSIGTYEDYKRIKCPIVGVDRARNSFEYSVFYDEENGGRLAAEAIVKGGAGKILVGAGPENIEVARDRLRGILEVLDREKADYHVYNSSGYDYESANEFASFIENADEKYDSIIACNDLHGICATLSLNRAGVEMPKDVQVIGYDDTIFSKLSNPGLSTIKHDGAVLGKKAAEMLIDLIEKADVEEKNIQLYSSLVKNGSTRNE